MAAHCSSCVRRVTPFFRCTFVKLNQRSCTSTGGFSLLNLSPYQTSLTLTNACLSICAIHRRKGVGCSHCPLPIAQWITSSDHTQGAVWTAWLQFSGQLPDTESHKSRQSDRLLRAAYIYTGPQAQTRCVVLYSGCDSV